MERIKVMTYKEIDDIDDIDKQISDSICKTKELKLIRKQLIYKNEFFSYKNLLYKCECDSQQFEVVAGFDDCDMFIIYIRCCKCGKIEKITKYSQ